MTAVTHHDSRAGLPTAVWTDWSCTVRLVVTDFRILDRATADVRELMQQVDRAASRFRGDSELSRANSVAGRPFPASHVLMDLVSGALAAARLTGGAVDPTVGGDLVRLGYDRDILLVRDPGSPGDDDAVRLRAQAARPLVASPRRRTWSDVRVDHEKGLLTVPVGAALDLGSTAKAQAADWAAARVSRRYGVDALVEIGGDLAVCGSKDDWQVVVAEREGAPGQQMTVRRGGLATSTTTIRTWASDGRTAHHLIDPSTGEPTDGPWRTATVAGDSALAANVRSTASIVKGAAAVAWLEQHGAAARLVDRDGQVVRVNGWPGDAISPSGRGAHGTGSPAC